MRKKKKMEKAKEREREEESEKTHDRDGQTREKSYQCIQDIFTLSKNIQRTN